MKIHWPFYCLMVGFCLLLIKVHLLLGELQKTRAENEQLRNERDYAQLAAEQLWGTINRAASEP